MKLPIDKIAHTTAGAAISAALLPWGFYPALLDNIDPNGVHRG